MFAPPRPSSHDGTRSTQKARRAAFVHERFELSIDAALNSSGSQSTVEGGGISRNKLSDFDQPAALFSFESTIEVRADLELPPLRALECIPMALHALERIPTA